MTVRNALLFGALVMAFTGQALAGIYSAPSGVTPGAPDNPIAKSQFTIFETSVVNFTPAPGVGPNFRSPTTGIASLGELYSPVPVPSGNTTFDKRYQPIVGAEPNSSHNGSTASPYGGDVNSTTDTYGFIGIDQPGSITLGFGPNRIINGPGPDFAVFENGFSFGGANSLFAELAYVEVSTDGVSFARFPSISLNTAPTAVSGTFQGYDMTNVFNLAGKHASNWGTPFNLDDLANDALVLGGQVDLNSINYVRLVDVVGSGPLTDSNGDVIPGIARDSLGNPILDNYLTFDSGGFDYLGLSTHAIGVINAVPEPGTWAVLIGVGAFAIVRGWRRRVS